VRNASFIGEGDRFNATMRVHAYAAGDLRRRKINLGIKIKQEKRAHALFKAPSIWKKIHHLESITNHVCISRRQYAFYPPISSGTGLIVSKEVAEGRRYAEEESAKRSFFDKIFSVHF